MRILVTADPELLVPPQYYGGIERIIDGLVRELQARGHAVGLVARAGSACPADELFPWPGETSQGRGDARRNALALRRATRQFRPDVVQSFSRLLYLLTLLGSGVPRVMSYQRLMGLSTVRWSHRLAGRKLEFTGCSEHVAALGRGGGGTWHAIPNFADLGVYDFSPAVADDAPLVFLSSVTPVKGPHVAIEVAKRTGRRLLIAGNHGTDGENGRYWREQIEPQLGRDGIEYVGPVDDTRKNELLGRAAAMIVPVEWEEPFGIVFAESLACGTPVISTPRGSLPEIVREGVDGFLSRDVAGHVAAVERLPQIDRADCRGRVEERFSQKVVVDQYEAVYRSMAGH